MSIDTSPGTSAPASPSLSTYGSNPGSTPTSTAARHSANGRSLNGGLITPEAVELEIPTASTGLRGLAYIIDLVVMAVIAFVIFWLGFGLMGLTENPMSVVWIIVLSILSLVIVLPMCVEVLTQGRSLGKMIAKLRVVTVEAAPIGWRHAAIRATVGAFELIATSGVIAFFVSLASPRSQRLGDMVAGTLVIRESVSKADIQPVWFRPLPGSEAFAQRLDISNLDDHDYSVIRAALLRSGLDPSQHAHVCGVIATQLWPRVSAAPLPTSLSPMVVLTAMASAYQGRHADRDGDRATDWVWRP